MPILINSQSGQAEDLPKEQADSALQNATHEIPLNDPQGNPVTAPLNQAQSLLSQGYSQPSPGQIKSLLDYSKFSSPTEQLKTGLEGAAEAASFGTSTALERGMGVDPKDIVARRETNPGVHTIGQIAGLGASTLIPGVGEANVLRSAGEGAATALGLGLKGSGLASGMAAGAARGAVEMALFQGGDEVSKLITEDPNQSADTAMANIGLSSLIGAGIGVPFGAISPVLEKLGATQGGQFVNDFKNGILDHLENPEPVPAIAKELQDYHGEITSAADDIYGAKGLKSQELEKLMPPMNDTILAQPNQVSDLINKSVQKMEAKPSIYGNRYSSILQGIKEDLQKSTQSLDNPEKVFSAIDEIKQKVGQYSDFKGKVSPDNPSYNGMKEVNQLYTKIRDTLEDSNVWGKAAERQQAINTAFKEFKPALEDFQKKFMTDVSGQKLIDQGKINTYVNQLGKPNAEIKQQMLNNFVDAAEKYKKVINDTHGTLGLESPFTPTSLSSTNKTLGQLSSGAKLANVVVSKGLAGLAGKSLGAGIGGAIGHTVGSPWLGAILGEQVLGPFFTSVIPSLVKPILKSIPSAEGFQSAVRFGLAVAKGEAALNRAASSVFKPGSISAPTRVPASDDKKTQRLEEHLNGLQQDSASLMNVGGQTGYYLPEHNSAMAQTAARATSYLNSIRPNEGKAGVLDPPRIPSQVEKAQYNRALSIANEPLQVIDRIKEGTLIPQDVMALRNMYPALYARMGQKLTNEMINHASKGNLIPYKTRLGLSLFAGQPLDSTLTAQAIQALQPQVPEAQPPQPGAARRGGGFRSMKGLEKLPSSFATPSQARELNSRTS